MASKITVRGHKTNVTTRTRERNLRNQRRAEIDGVRHIVNPGHGTIRTDYIDRRVERKEKRKRGKQVTDLSKPLTCKRGRELQKSVMGPDPTPHVMADRPEPIVYRNLRRIRVRGVETMHLWRYLVTKEGGEGGSGREEKKGREVFRTYEEGDAFHGDVPIELGRMRTKTNTNNSGQTVVTEQVEVYVEQVPVDVTFYNVFIDKADIFMWAWDTAAHKTDLSQAVASVIRNEPKSHMSVMGIDYNCIRKALGMGEKETKGTVEQMFDNFAHGLPSEMILMDKVGVSHEHIRIVPIWALYPLLCSLPLPVLELNDIYGMCFDLYCNLMHKAPRDVGWKMERLNLAIDALRISLSENEAQFRELYSQKIATKEDLVDQIHSVSSRVEAIEAYIKTQGCRTDDNQLELTELKERMERMEQKEKQEEVVPPVEPQKHKKRNRKKRRAIRGVLPGSCM